MIEEIKTALEPLIKSKGLDFIISNQKYPDKMKNDEEMIKRIVLNFLNNATNLQRSFVKYGSVTRKKFNTIHSGRQRMGIEKKD
jgi:hypothetical protein